MGRMADHRIWKINDGNALKMAETRHLVGVESK